TNGIRRDSRSSCSSPDSPNCPCSAGKITSAPRSRALRSVGETSSRSTWWPASLSPRATAFPLIRLMLRSALGPPERTVTFMAVLLYLAAVIPLSYCFAATRFQRRSGAAQHTLDFSAIQQHVTSRAELRVKPAERDSRPHLDFRFQVKLVA